MDKKQIFKTLINELKNQNTDEIKNKLITNMNEMYGIPEGVTNSFTVKNLDEKFFETTDIRLITLFIIEAFKVFGRQDKLSEYVTKGEQDEAKQYDYKSYSKKSNINLPMELFPVVPINNTYGTKLSVQQIAELVNSGIINYNFDIQREATLEIRTDKVIKKPTLNMKNIKEMEKLLLNDSLKESTIYLNAAPKTSLEGEELLYNNEDYSLVITEGSRLDVLDGFHRVLAAQRAYSNNTLLDFEFSVVFSNYTTSEAIRWQEQHSKATSWSKNRMIELQQDSKASKVVKAIKDSDVELERMIATSKHKNKNSLITYSYLTNIIDELFDIQTRREEVNLAEDLSKVLFLINELKEVNLTFKSQAIVKSFIKLYANSYNKEISEFTNFMEELLEYLRNHEYDFTMAGNKLKDNEKLADQKIEKLKNKIEKTEGIR